MTATDKQTTVTVAVVREPGTFELEQASAGDAKVER